MTCSEVCVYCFKRINTVSVYIKHAKSHNGPNERKNGFISGICDDLRLNSVSQLDRMLDRLRATVDTSLGETQSKKRARETIDLDPAASPSPKRVRTTVHETDMMTVSTIVEVLQGESTICLAARSVLIPKKLLNNLAMNLPASGIWSPRHILEWTCLRLHCFWLIPKHPWKISMRHCFWTIPNRPWKVSMRHCF